MTHTHPSVNGIVIQRRDDFENIISFIECDTGNGNIWIRFDPFYNRTIEIGDRITAFGIPYDREDFQFNAFILLQA